MDSVYFFFFNDTATTEIYTLSLHDALPILSSTGLISSMARTSLVWGEMAAPHGVPLDPTPMASTFSGCGWISGPMARSEEHTSELQSRQYLVCRLLLEKKNKTCSNRHLIAG